MSDAGILFLHPVGLDHRSTSWTNIPAHIAASMPGHGGRKRAGSGLTLDDMADEVVGWVHRPLHVIGASMGGMVALHLALNHPAMVKSLVLSCTSAKTGADVMSARADETERRGSRGMLEDTMTRWFTAEALAQDPLPEPLSYARESLLAMSSGALADTWRALGGHDVLDRLSDITVPTTCIAGLRDVSSPPEVVQRLAGGLVRSRYVEIDAPHMAHLQNPKDFAAAVEEHFEWDAVE